MTIGNVREKDRTVARCPLCGHAYRVEKQAIPTEDVVNHPGAPGVPLELTDLPLYAADVRLCRRWGGLFVTWQRSYPGMDVMHEIRRAHGWERVNPKRRKRDKIRFLARWLENEARKLALLRIRRGLDLTTGGQVESAEREILIGAILSDDMQRSRIGHIIPWQGHCYTIRAEGLEIDFGTGIRILPWVKIPTPDLKDIGSVANRYDAPATAPIDMRFRAGRPRLHVHH